MPLKNIANEAQDTLKDSMQGLLRVGSAMYMYVAEEVISRFGFKGERTIRQHVREYAKWRGNEMRMAHQALGLPINVETLLKHWDYASVIFGVQEEKSKYSKNKVVHNVAACPASELWRSHQFWRYGHMFCDEFHQTCGSSYHPDIYVVIPENIMKGDPTCTFYWIMPPQTKDIDFGPITELGKKLSANYIAKSQHEAVAMALKRSIRIIGGRYFTLAKKVKEDFDKQGEEALHFGLNKWSIERGRILRNLHDSLAMKISFSNLFNNFDLLYQFYWNAKEISGEKSYILEISECPLADCWNDLGDLHLGYHYCSVTYPAFLKGYGMTKSFELKECLSKGDKRCILQLSLA